ncbi:MAG: hypothetical protein IFK91_11935 [Acidobacteria bacterium]|nr:hypothetical protein [Candidatus Sulfomarinibacter sp. MAG AM1]
MRRILIVIALMTAPNFAVAADVDFSLNIDQISLTPRPTPKKEAQLAGWNSPMGRLMHNFNQQQAWIMRGTMPGGERVNGLAVKVKAQNGLPIHLLATTMQASIDVSESRIAVVRWPWSAEEKDPVMSLDEQLSLLLGQRLTGSH